VNEERTSFQDMLQRFEPRGFCDPACPSEPRFVSIGANDEDKGRLTKTFFQATNIAISPLVIARMLISMIPNTNCTTHPI
jgi:hypothetical protein